MGLFSSKKKISVSSTSAPLIGIEPQLITKAVLNVIRNGDNLTERLIQDMLDGAGPKVRRAYRYARDNYTLGLPQGYSESLNYDDTQIEGVIEASIGEPITLRDSILDYGDPGFQFMKYVNENYDWDFETNDVTTTEKGSADGIARLIEFRDALSDASVAALPEAEAPTTGTYENGIQWKRTVTYNRNVDFVLGADSAVFTSKLDNVVFSEYDAELEQVDVSYDFVYTLATSFSGGYVITRIEKLETWAVGLDPTVDDPSLTTFTKTYTEDSLFESYFDEWSTTQSLSITDYTLQDYYYFATYRLADGSPKVWLYKVEDGTYPELAFTTYTGNSSPFYPIVPIRRHNVDLCAEGYWETELYKTSKKLLDKIEIDIQDIRTAINENPDVGEIDHAILMFGTRLNTDNKAAIEYLARFWDRMYGQYVSDTGSSANGSFKVQDSVLDLRISWSDIDVETVTGRAHPTEEAARDFEEGYVEFRLQTGDNRYKRIKVYNPVLTNYVYSGHTVVTNLSDAQSEDNNNFVIPLHYDIVDSMGALKRNSLYYDSLQMVFNSYKVTKVKWYQRSFFQTLLKIAAIALTIYTMGSGSFAAAIVAGDYAAAAMILIEAIVVSYAISVGFKYLVKALGIENSFIVAVIAAAIAVYQLSVSGWNIDQAAWADVLLQAASGLSSGISANLGEAFKDLQNDFDVFEEEYKESLDALKEAQELLSVDGLIDPMEFVYSEPMINFNEYPSDYYERTIHSGNTGTLGFKIMSNYHDLMLDLPKPNYGL
jgi:hypothetical protein